MSGPDPAAIARTIVDDNVYMVLGTADEAGRPWVSPVYYAPSRDRELFWVSDPSARHSRNIEARPEISVVIFDSRQPVGTGQGVYLEARAEQVSGADVARGVEVFSRRSLQHGAREWTLDMVQAPARHRLYRATAAEVYVVDGNDRRLSLEL